MGQRDGLGRLLGAGGEEDRGDGIGRGMTRTTKDAARQRPNLQQREQGFEPSDLPTQVLDIEELDAGDVQPEAVAEPPRGDDVGQAGQADRVAEVRRAGRRAS